MCGNQAPPAQGGEGRPIGCLAQGWVCSAPALEAMPAEGLGELNRLHIHGGVC